MRKKIAPLSLSVSESKNNSRLLVEVAGATQIVCGLLVAVFNILFIYYGISSGWYYFKDSFGTEMKVISIGEGILAGCVYIVFASFFLYNLHWPSSYSAHKLVFCSVIILLTSVTLVLANTCQLGLVSRYRPSSASDGAYPDIERSFMEKVEKQQVITLSLQLSTHLLVFITALAALLGLNKISGPKVFVN